MKPITSINLKGICGIYAWIHRESGMCYIGSSTNIGRRTTQHLRESRPGVGTSLLARAVREFGADAFDLELLCECGRDELPGREKFYITLFAADSIDGFNIHSNPASGTRGTKASEATRARMSISHKDMWTPEARERAAAAKRGTKRSPEALAKFKASMTGRKVSEETRRKISEAHKGMKHSPESLAKMAAWKRKSPDEDQRRRQSKAMKAREIHPNSIAALNPYSNKGRKHSPEVVAAHSARMRAQHARKRHADILALALPYQCAWLAMQEAA